MRIFSILLLLASCVSPKRVEIDAIIVAVQGTEPLPRTMLIDSHGHTLIYQGVLGRLGDSVECQCRSRSDTAIQVLSTE